MERGEDQHVQLLGESRDYALKGGKKEWNGYASAWDNIGLGAGRETFLAVLLAPKFLAECDQLQPGGRLGPKCHSMIPSTDMRYFALERKRGRGEFENELEEQRAKKARK